MYYFYDKKQRKTKMTTEKVLVARPQEPNPPFPYHVEDVSYETKAPGVTIAGTLTLPQGDGPFPGVILISGMGPKDRDSSMGGHKPFAVLADHLTRNGIAVLRFDKRGVGKSTGTYDLSITSKEFAADVLAGVKFFRRHPSIDRKKIGLIGSSEGGMIAPMVATECADISFLVLMAGVVETNAKLAVKQAGAQMRADGASEGLLSRDYALRTAILETIRQEPNIKTAKQLCMATLEEYFKNLPADIAQEAEQIHFAFTHAKAEQMIGMFNSPWYRFFLNYNPVEMLKKVTVPVLAINGDLDHIVPSKRSLNLILKTLNKAGNNKVTTTEFPHMNHQFQTCQTGAIKEYTALEETIAPQVLDTIAEWIKEKTT